MSADLLLDFGESPTSTPAQNGTNQSSDPFDPFGPVSGDANLIDVKQTNGAADSFDPFVTKSSDSNPLYELEHGDDNDTNPLYELSKNGDHDETQLQEGDYQELQSPRGANDDQDYQELVSTGDKEIERTEETYEEEDGTIVTVTTITTMDADGNTMTEILESRTTEETRDSGDEEEVVIETHEEVVHEGSDVDEVVETVQPELRRHSVSSNEGEEPYSQGVTIETVNVERRTSISSDEGLVEKGDDEKSVSSDDGGEPYSSGVTMETVKNEQEEDDRKSVSSEEGGEPYSSGVTMETVANEPQEEEVEEEQVVPEIKKKSEAQISSEYEDGQEYAGSETDSLQSTEKPGIQEYAEEQYEEYVPPKRVEKTESVKKDTGPQYTIMSETETSEIKDKQTEHDEEEPEGMPSATTYTRKVSTETKTAPADRPKEVAKEHDLSGVTGDDKVDDGLDNCPKLGNLKSRFEEQQRQAEEQRAAAVVERKAPRVRPARTKPSQEAPAETRMDEELLERMEIIETPRSPVTEEEEKEIPRDPNVARESKEKEEVHFTELASVKSRFEHQATESSSVPSPAKTPRTRKSLTPDENKPAPPVVNREETDQVEELPPVGTSKSLLAKFKSMESGTAPSPSKPQPKKMTPPREQARPVSEDRESTSSDTERVRAADKTGEVVEEELPTPGTAKNLFAKFRSMEDQTASPPTPQRKSTNQKQVRHGYGYHVDLPNRKSATNTEVVNSESAPQKLESGEFESTPEVRTDVVREHDFSYEMNPEGGEFENTPEVRPDLVREEDRHDEEEFPEEGMAKNLLAKFKSIETSASQRKEYKPSGVGNKATPTPLRSSARAKASSRDDVSSTSDADSMTESQHSLGGEYESTPEVRTDVLKETDHIEEEELPEEGMARNLLAKFKNIESSSPQIALLPKNPVRKSSPRKATSTHSVDADSGIYENEPAQRSHHEPTLEGGEFENTPEQRADVVREQDTVEEEELPEEGTTKNLLAKFKAMQAN